MNRIETLLLCIAMPALLVSCSNKRQDTTQGGDMTAKQDSAMEESVSREKDSLQRKQAEEPEIHAIDGTARFVIFENGDVFDTENKKVLFRTECDWSDGFAYFGTCGDIFLFGNMDALCFSDGTHIELQPNAYYQLTDDGQTIHFTLGAQYMDISPSELHRRASKLAKRDYTIVHIEKGYFVRPRTEVSERIGNGLGFDVDMDVPSGSNAADIAIRQWMMEQIKNDAFDLLEYNAEGTRISKCGSVKEMLRSLDLLGDVWKKALRSEKVDTLYDKIDSRIAIRKIVDCQDYVTYYFGSVPYTGGVHALPRSYYATYDKRRNVFLTASNTLKKSTRSKFAALALQNMKKQHDDYCGQKSEWQDYTKAVFSTEVFLYCCDKNTEWKDKDTPYNLSDFPLPHLAIIPEGMVVTYHPYQIDCFAADEYHAVMPLKDIAGCLKHKYEQVTNNKRLDRFVKIGKD